ncbi:MAG: S9 family peptidase [Balneolaceae bacterium]|nr:S9 family peptidase [Balneolaceae bacterium]
MKKILYLILFSFFITPNAIQAQGFPDELTLKDIFHEPFIPGSRPSFSHFSPKGKTIYFRWNDSTTSKTELFQVGLSGKNLKKAPDGVRRGFELSPNGDKLIFSRRGDLILADADFENERTIVASDGYEYNATWNADGTKFAFIQNGDVWISGVNEAYMKQVTSRKEEDPGYSIIAWAGDDRLVLYQWDNSDSREYYFPEYTGRYVRTGATRRGIPTVSIHVAYIDSNKVEKVIEQKGRLSPDVSANGRYLAIDVADSALKNRKIILHDLDEGTKEIIFEDSTEGWLYGMEMEFAPSGNMLMFQSEKDGWNNIYSIDAATGGLQKHTYADYDIPWVAWLDSHTMVIATTQDDPGDVQLMKLDMNTNELTHLTTEEGHRRNFRLSRDHRYVVYSKTYFNEPFDLYLVDTKIPRREVQLTHSVPESFYEYDWQKEDYVKVNSRDGETKLSMSVLKPARRNPDGNPVVVFVHGAGSLQNVYKGWSSSYWREYMFNQYLAKQGYYVIEVDYRHSTGYGRKFREDVTNWMGKYETQDIEDGLAYLADNYVKADTSRVGIYGGSYGGFMALYAVSVAPEHFDAAAALRSVTNWENYYYSNPGYTLPRLGTPKQDSVNYARSSPLTYADSLTKPVLLLHGLIDNNVGFQDAVHYIEELIQSGNENFDMMMYPSERHSFRDEDAWYDEYRRIYAFFEENLRQH